jgi:hypothetical protein
MQTDLARSGILVDDINTLYGAIGQSGGTLSGILGTGALGTTMAERMDRYGINPSVMGSFLSTAGRANPWNPGTAENNMQLMATTFGVGRTGQGLAQIGQILEAAMARGARQGSTILEQGAGRIAREAAYLGQVGGFSMEAAYGMVGRLDERIAAGARPQTAADTMMLRAVMSEKPELSLFEAQEFIGRDPKAAREVMMQNLILRTGGNRDLMGHIVSDLGFAPYEAGAIVDMALATGGLGGNIGAGLGKTGGILKYGKPITADQPMVNLKKTLQVKLLDKMGPYLLKQIFGTRSTEQVTEASQNRLAAANNLVNVISEAVTSESATYTNEEVLEAEKLMREARVSFSRGQQARMARLESIEIDENLSLSKSQAQELGLLRETLIEVVEKLGASAVSLEIISDKIPEFE